MTLIKVEQDQGKGRAFIIVYEQGNNQNLASYLFSILSQETRVLVISTTIINEQNWAAITSELINTLSNAGIRQAAFVGLSAASSIVQNLALVELKLVRSLVLVDATTRAHPSSFSRAIDWLESHLPLGLPLRSLNKGFDAKPFLHRLRCPVLVAVTQGSDLYTQGEAEVLKKLLPTAWFVEIEAQENLAEAIKKFQGVPAKCPQ